MPKSFYNGCENEQKPYENRKIHVLEIHQRQYYNRKI